MGAFRVPTGYVFGNSGRTILAGPRRSSWDSSVFKNFHVKENLRIQFRFEAFNFLNHPSFAQPAANIGTTAAGTISGTVGSPRQLQFALKLLF